MIFETERLLVRQLVMSDFLAYFEMQGNPVIHLYTGSAADDEVTARAGLVKCIEAYQRPGNDFWIWAITRKEDRKMVGTCAIVQGESEPTGAGAEIGYRFLEQYWGNGYAGEICNPLIQYGLQEMGLEWVFAQVDCRNRPSVKVLERSSLRFLKEYYNETDACMDRVYWSK